MLTSLSIKNYALIQHLQIDFSDGLSIITGETGAGKSILLGALGLVLGNRADTKTLKNTHQKCVVEAGFSIETYQLQDFFETLDVDYDSHTIIRREILPSGKSRAFVNDTPVNLATLSQLKMKLMDVHSQHQTLALSETDFQFSALDALANNEDSIHSYKRGLHQLNLLKKALEIVEQNQQEARQQYDYNLYLFEELEKANLQVGEQEIIEEQLGKLNNIEVIKANLSEAIEISTNEEIGVQNLVATLQSKLQKTASFSKEYAAIYERITSLKIELDDIIAEVENVYEIVDFDPTTLEKLNDRLQLIYQLQKKHGVSSVQELLVIWEQLSEKVEMIESGTETIDKKRQEITIVTEKLDALAKQISNARAVVIPKLKENLESLLKDLGITNARFLIEVQPTENYFNNGKDTLAFLFSANRGSSFGTLKKVASGGELSRIMLSIKKILSENTQLPTIIFDEIDTGVSGEVSNKIAAIMQQMSTHMQVIAITHLPQIAAKGKQHYKVYKEDENGETKTSLKQLSAQDRIVEIAEMLSGKEISDSAITHAKQLLN